MSVPHRSRTDLAQILAETKERLRLVEGELKSLSKEVLTARVIRREIFKLSDLKPECPAWMQDIPRVSAKSPGIPVAVASDWHWGERINPDEIGGVNKYDMDIAHARAKAFFEGIITLLKKHMVRPDYPGIILCLGGDMFSGNIHEELVETNVMPIMPAFDDLFGVLVAGILLLKAEFGNVVIPCVTGNHSRNTMKMRAKERNHTSFDWLLYTLLERHFKDDPKIKFLVSMGVDQHFHVFNHKFMLTHGDTLGKGGDGIIGAYGPVIRGDQKTRARNAAIDQSYDTMIIGHYHQLNFMKRVIMNGSLCGYNEYANNVLRAPFEIPQQALFCVHPEHGITYQMPILVEPQKLHKTPSWVSWPDTN